MIYIFHGRLGNYNLEKQEFFELINNGDGSVIQPKLDYEDIVTTMKKLKEDISFKIKQENPECIMFVGTSLGGFVAEYFAHYFGSKLLMINPF